MKKLLLSVSFLSIFFLFAQGQKKTFPIIKDYGGVPRNHLHLDVVIFYKAIFVILDNDAYKKKFGVDNPNLKIIEEMKQAGINLYACGQSATGFGIDPKTVNQNFEVVLSRATTVSTRQMKGYAFFAQHGFGASGA